MGWEDRRANPYSEAERHLPFMRALGTAVWAAGGDASITEMGHWPPGRAGPAARTAVRRLLWEVCCGAPAFPWKPGPVA